MKRKSRIILYSNRTHENMFRELLKNTISYAVEANDPSLENFGVTWGSETNRISFCMTLTKDGCDQPGSDCQIEEAQDIIRKSVYYNKECSTNIKIYLHGCY